MKSITRKKGFTLIELAIVVTIIGILSALAIPAYSNYVTQSKRSDGRAGLLKMQMAQEKYRANNPSYGTMANLGYAATIPSPAGYYNLSVSGTPNSTSYVLQAVPTFTDSACGTLTIDNTDAKTASGTLSGTPTSCWNK